MNITTFVILIIINIIIVIVLIILVIDFVLQLCRTIKENAKGLTKDVKEEKQLYCPYCGINNISQITKMIIVMQLPGTAIDCACFYCNGCSKRWFMEMNTLE